MNTRVQLNKKKKPSAWENLIKATNYFYDRFFRALFVSLLMVFDLVLFVYSINGRLLEQGVLNEAVIYISGGIFAVFLVIMFLLSFSGVAQNIFCAVCVMLVTVLFLNQFALFNVDTFVETWLQQHASFLTFIGIVPSAWLVGFCLGLIVFFVFKYTPSIILSVLSVGVALGIGVYQTENLKMPTEEYQIVKNLSVPQANEPGHNLVYIMAPKFPSYHFLSTIKDVNFRDLRDLMVGFYAVNNFEIYPNAFVQKGDTVSNIVDIYNHVDYTSTTSGIRGYAEILNDWNFVNGSLEEMALEENKLYDVLGKNGYKTSTYALPAFNLCYNGGKMFSDRCVLKQNHPVSIYDKKSTLEKNIYALLGEWVQSLHSRDMKSVVKSLLDMSSLRGMKVLSDNRRLSIEGAPVLFDKLYEDFAKDGSGVAYMAFAELPSDLYIYDEFCNLKPRKQWVALKDNSIYTGGIDEKRKAYADQTKCFIGLMQMYMEKMYQNDKLAQTDIIIQGVSPLRELAGMPTGQYGTFVADKLISLGIRRGNKPNFVVNTEICLASDITKSFITGGDFCYTIDNMKMTTDNANNLKKNLINNSVIRGSKISNIAADYLDWYEEFRKHSPYYSAEREAAAENVLPPVKAAVPVQPQPVAAAAEEVQEPVQDIVALPIENLEVETPVVSAEVNAGESEAETAEPQPTEQTAPQADVLPETPAETAAEKAPAEEPKEEVEEEPTAVSEPAPAEEPQKEVVLSVETVQDAPKENTQLEKTEENTVN